MSEPIVETRDAELAALIAEQEKDAQWGNRVQSRGPSLDYAFEGGGTFADIVGYQAPTAEGGVRRIPRPQKWSRRQIIRHIRAWVKEHGAPPTYDEWRAPDGRGFPNTHSVVRRFGSFNAAIEAAGYTPRPRGGGLRHATEETGWVGACRPRVYKQRVTARLSSADLAAAFVLYDRKGLSTYQIADLIWERFGYPSAKACRTALHVGFYAEGFPVRDRGAARRLLSPEQRTAMASVRRLSRAQRAEIRVRRGEPQAALAAEYGVSISAISYHQRVNR